MPSTLEPRIATFNIGPTGGMPDLEALAGLADIIVCQEGSDQHQLTADFVAAHPEWIRFHSNDAGKDAVPILVRRDFAREGSITVDYRLAVGVTWVGPVGAGPTNAHRKFIAHLTAGRLHVLDTHLIPSYTRSKAELGVAEWEARRQHVRDHVAAILKLVAEIPDDHWVILCGDFNGQHDHPLLAPLKEAGFAGWTTEPTHDGSSRGIDHVLRLKHRGIRYVGRRIIETLSDHKAVIGSFLLVRPVRPEPAPEPEPAPPVKIGPLDFEPPSPPYLGPASHTSPGSNRPILRLVIHSTVSPCEPGGARNIAGYFRSSKAGGSAHYVNDCDEDVQVVFDGVIAWHAPPNPHTLGFEMCDVPGPKPGDRPGTAAFRAAKRAWRWAKPRQRRMLRRTAALVAESALAEGIPLRWLSVKELKAKGPNRATGITSHANTSLAYGQSTHWDPGFWPRVLFMRWVKAEAKRLTAEATARAVRKASK